MFSNLAHSPANPHLPESSVDSDDDFYSHSMNQFNSRGSLAIHATYMPANVLHWAIYLLRYLGAVMLLLLVVGCGPEVEESNSDELVAETEQIARNYAASNDLNNARIALSSISVANPNQWLVYVAESRINNNNDPVVADALVRLSLDLGLNSATIERRAVEIGLLVPTPEVIIESAPQQAIQAAGNENAAPAQAQVVEQPASQTESSANESSSSESTTENEAQPAEATAAPAEEPTPTEAPADPVIAANDGMNVRSGPGTTYPIVGALQAGELASAIAKTAAGDWWQVLLASGQEGWVFAQLVTPSGNVDSVAVAATIPTPPPSTPTPIPEPTATPVPEEPAQPPRSGNDFVMIEKRLWGPEENGGRMNGPSLTCGEKRELHVKVVDAAGNLLNGVAVQAQYGAKEIFVTGEQGKGEGMAEFVLGDGQDVKVVRDVDGRDVSSDLAAGLVTIPYQIPFENLIQSGYCTDDASCQKNIVDPYACGGHYSWDVTFQRTY